MPLNSVRIKEEIEWEEDPWEASEATEQSGLYDDHDVKPDLVLGPEVLQPQDVDYSIRDSSKQVKQEPIQEYAEEVTVPGTSTGEFLVEAIPSSKTHRKPLKLKTTSKKLKLVFVARKHSCNGCHKVFKLKSRFLKHSCKQAEEQRNLKKTLQINTQKRIYLCTICGKTYMYKGHLLHHIKIHTEGITCEICNNRFTKNTYRSHVHTRQERKSFCCDHCKKQFKCRSGIINHMHTHQEKKPFCCDHCKKRFKCRSGIITHMTIHTKNPKEKPYCCHICQKQFTVKSGLAYHLLIHTGKKPFPCRLCDKQFRDKSSLRQHKYSHTKCPHSCHICQKQFKVKAGLAYHMRIHSGEKPFSCEVCNKQFREKAYLVLHKQLHTEGNRYSCQICKKQLTHKAHLAYHMKSHTAYKPHSCHVCKKQFKLKATLNIHLRIHTGENLHSCKTCSKKFTTLSNLSRHKQTHLKKLKKPIELPFSCDKCKKLFKDWYLLTRHKCGKGWK